MEERMNSKRCKTRILVFHPDGRTEEVVGVKTAAAIAGLNYQRVGDLIRKGGQSRKGYSFDYAADYEPMDKTAKLRRLTSPDGVVYEVTGLRPAARVIGVSVMTLMRNPEGCHGWKVEEVQG
jgi:hypothetical protein